MSKQDLRHQAYQCLTRAKELLNAGDEASLRYACLELRFCIEYVTYDQLESYLKEVSSDAVKKWTPKQVIGEMLEVDPFADQSATIAVGIEEVPGTPARHMRTVGEDRRFSIRWASTNHNALGNFLHAPTLYQIGSGREPNLSVIMKKAKEIMDMLDYILSSSMAHVSMGYFYNFDCAESGTTIRRRSGSFTKQQGVLCPNSKCRAIYDLTDEEEEEYFRLRLSSYECPECQTINHTPTYQVKHDNIITCKACGDTKMIKRQFILAAVDHQSSSPSKDQNKEAT